MRTTILILIGVISVGAIVASAGFLTNEKYVESPMAPTDYESLQKYKIELEKINQFNLEEIGRASCRERVYAPV